MRLTAKERILLHLLESCASPEAVEVPSDLTQGGIVRGAGIELRHVAQFVRPLIEEGLVQERTSHVTGKRQRMKVYELTLSGRSAAIRLRETLKTQAVRVRDGGAIVERPLAEVLRGSGRTTRLLSAVREVERTGALDLAEPRVAPASGFIEQVRDAPRIQTFVGREKELTAIVREGGRARIVVVRGIAGIGKSALGAQACERLRGRRNLFWHRVRPWETGPTILASLGRFLEALDRPGLSSVLKRGESASVAEVLRQDLPDTDAFLVFDDVHEASEDALTAFRILTEAVADAPDVKVLILTRRALPFYDVRAVAMDSLVEELELGALQPDEVAALLAQGGDLESLAGLGRRLAGHPLFVELVRRYRSDLPKGVQYGRRFMEESIYRDLPEPERVAMKGASLYRVPVPLSALLAIPATSYEAILALQDRALIRQVELERYEVHDTIRDFFGRILTDEERHRFGARAVVQLRDLSAQASAAGDVVASIACLSNAVQIAESSEDRRALLESLGDANSLIGDLTSMTAAYREGLRLADDPRIAARLHRKLAIALEDRGYMTAATEEIQAGLAALEGRADVEVGWLNLARARVAEENFDWGAAERFAETARDAFQGAHETTGQALALLEAGLSASWTGSTTPDGRRCAEICFQDALRHAEAMHESILEARIHLAMAIAIGYGSGAFEEGMKHFRAIESSPVAMANPKLGPTLHTHRAWFILRRTRDLAAAEKDLSEGRRLALKVRNAGALAVVTYQSAVIAGERGQYEEAGRLDEEAGSASQRTGFGAFAADAYFSAGAFYLAAGDWAGYRRVSASLVSPRLARYTRNPLEKPFAHAAFEALVRGDVAGFERVFEVIRKATDAFPASSIGQSAGRWWGHLYYGMGLRALGREREADEHRRLARELARLARNAQAVNYADSDYGERIAETLRAHLKTIDRISTRVSLDRRRSEERIPRPAAANR